MVNDEELERWCVAGGIMPPPGADVQIGGGDPISPARHRAGEAAAVALSVAGAWAARYHELRGALPRAARRLCPRGFGRRACGGRFARRFSSTECAGFGFAQSQPNHRILRDARRSLGASSRRLRAPGTRVGRRRDRGGEPGRYLCGSELLGACRPVANSPGLGATRSGRFRCCRCGGQRSFAPAASGRGDGLHDGLSGRGGRRASALSSGRRGRVVAGAPARALMTPREAQPTPAA